MTSKPQENIPVGTPVIGLDGTSLGEVREVHPHYFLVGQEDQHEDIEVQTQSILCFADGTLTVSVTDESVKKVDNAETAHYLMDDEA